MFFLLFQFVSDIFFQYSLLILISMAMYFSLLYRPNISFTTLLAPKIIMISSAILKKVS